MRPRVQALVALRLLEVLKSQDAPPEVLEDENPTHTMPRRLGLSNVVDRQIRQYREDVRRRVRLPDAEIRDLFRLVLRRPDSEDVFLELGRILAGAEPTARWRRRLPRSVAYALARRRVAKRLKTLFGRRVGGFGRGDFSVEGRSLPFIEADPGGDACHLVSGLCERILSAESGSRAMVRHTLCQARRDALCRWEGEIVEEAFEPALVRNPDPAEG
jgi:hypothetical protein